MPRYLSKVCSRLADLRNYSVRTVHRSPKTTIIGRGWRYSTVHSLACAHFTRWEAGRLRLTRLTAVSTTLQLVADTAPTHRTPRTPLPNRRSLLSQEIWRRRRCTVLRRQAGNSDSADEAGVSHACHGDWWLPFRVPCPAKRGVSVSGDWWPPVSGRQASSSGSALACSEFTV